MGCSLSHFGFWTPTHCPLLKFRNLLKACCSQIACHFISNISMISRGTIIPLMSSQRKIVTEPEKHISATLYPRQSIASPLFCQRVH